GPRQRPDMGFHRFLKAVLREQAITVYGDGEQTRDFTYIDDIVSATTAAADRGVAGRVYNIGGGARVSLNHVLDLLGAVTGRPIRTLREGAQKGDMRDTYADTRRARTDLAFSPATTLADGLRAEYDWLRATPLVASL
ncbi:MAG: NAD-dependent epimerase/dehydratase family protein, partial [Vicinamibacterales bacterium]|nr:NAD-dependent epimerase/dehydratase family protein [Vicinamibacterales bacterium]